MNLSPRYCLDCASVATPMEVDFVNPHGRNDYYRNASPILVCYFVCLKCVEVLPPEIIEFETKELALNVKAFIVSLGFRDSDTILRLTSYYD